MDNTNMMYPVPLSGGIPLSFIAQYKGISFDFETDFEPQTRARSNTWPLPRPEGYTENNIVHEKEVIEVAASPQQVSHEQMEGLLSTKKSSSRRNAWGNLSYADLITQAISSSPENRLTLSQIYNWMIQNVPYFKDKGDSNSSAGWKNSIRHNLSLHNIFMRVQNEGTGKSSWWTLNPDAKPGKSSRRRAASMETSKFEKLRGRVKKKVKSLRNGIFQAASMTPSPCSSVNEGLDVFPESPFHPSSSGFRTSPDFRSRASSTASSVGRLSPIPAVLNEPDWTPSYVQSSSYNPEELVSNLAGSMKLESYKMYQTSLSSHQHQQKDYQSVPSPSYLEEQYLKRHTMISANLPYRLSPTRQNCPIHGFQSCACLMNQNPVSGMSPSYQHSESNHSLMDAFQEHQPQQLQQHEQQEQEETLEHLIGEFVFQQEQQQNNQQLQQHHQQPNPQSGHADHLGLSATSCTLIPNTVMGQLMGVLNNNDNNNNNNNRPLLDDLDISIEKLHNGLDRDDEEIIKNVLSMDDTYADVQFSGNDGLSYDLGLKL